MEDRRGRAVSHGGGALKADGWQHPSVSYLYVSMSVHRPQGVTPAFLLMRERERERWLVKWRGRRDSREENKVEERDKNMKNKISFCAYYRAFILLVCDLYRIYIQLFILSFV